MQRCCRTQQRRQPRGENLCWQHQMCQQQRKRRGGEQAGQSTVVQTKGTRGLAASQARPTSSKAGHNTAQNAASVVGSYSADGVKAASRCGAAVLDTPAGLCKQQRGPALLPSALS